MDRFYTPPALAETLVAEVSTVQPRAVADFAAGDGRLLAAAGAKWPNAHIAAADVDEKALRRLRRKYPHWSIMRRDFLRERGWRLGKSTPFSQFDVVLLNPPFSCRGGRRWTSKFGEDEIRSGLAMAFVLRALDHVVPGGEVLAILPAGATSSEKDALAWAAVRRQAHVTVLRKNGYRTFEGCYPKTVLVRIQKTLKENESEEPPVVTRSTGWQVFRGSIQVHRVTHKDTGATLIHSTSLQGNRIVKTRRVAHDGKLFAGPAVLIPRVGVPRVDKVAVLREGRRVLLTDCVMAVRCSDTVAAHSLRQQICARWADLEQRYRGTCAQYLTVNELHSFLETLSFSDQTCSAIAR